MNDPIRYIPFGELKEMLDTITTQGHLDGPTARRLVLEHARLSALSHDLIWANLGCPKHRSYRGTTARPPTRDCKWCHALWEVHHQARQSFDEQMAAQVRLVRALLKLDEATLGAATR